MIRYLLYLLDTILGHLPINPRNLLYFELLISEDSVKYCPYDLWQHVWQYVWLICIYYVVPIGGMIGKIIHKQFWTCAVSSQPTQSTHVIKAVMTKLFLPFTPVKKKCNTNRSRVPVKINLHNTYLHKVCTYIGTSPIYFCTIHRTCE